MVAGQQQQQQLLRKGKWTPAEEAYATRLIQEFQAGILPLIEGTSLRTFLSEFLYCAPMRISKKLRLGVQVFQRRQATAELERVTPAQLQQIWADLNDLERRFVGRDPVDTQQFRACVLAKSTCFNTPIGMTDREQEDRPKKKYKTSQEEKKKDTTTNQQHHEYRTSENEREMISEHAQYSKQKNQEQETDDTFCEIDDYGLLRVPTYHIYTYSESSVSKL